jgi:hypothetical protein
MDMSDDDKNEPVPVPEPLGRNDNAYNGLAAMPRRQDEMVEPNCQSVLDELQLYKNYFAENGLAPLSMPRMGGRFSYRRSRKSRKSRRRRFR